MSNSTETSSSTNAPQTTPTPVSVANLDGQVKWFNNKQTYGWITVITEGQYKGTEIFVHQSNIKASGYRTLMAGEYVNFDLSPSVGENHPYHALNVTGIGGGLLMCDFKALNNTKPIRNKKRNTRTKHTPEKTSNNTQ